VVTVVRFVVWTCALEVVWAVLVGTTQSTELVAGLLAAAVTAAFVEVLRRHGLLEFRFLPSAIGRAWSIPGKAVFDFGLLTWIVLKAVVRRRAIRGEWVTSPFPAPDGPQGRFLRAVAGTLENDVANGLVVDLDDGRVLLHSFDTRFSTGTKVL
jgi:hypothetical protein